MIINFYEFELLLVSTPTVIGLMVAPPIGSFHFLADEELMAVGGDANSSSKLTFNVNLYIDFVQINA